MVDTQGKNTHTHICTVPCCEKYPLTHSKKTPSWMWIHKITKGGLFEDCFILSLIIFPFSFSASTSDCHVLYIFGLNCCCIAVTFGFGFCKHTDLITALDTVGHLMQHVWFAAYGGPFSLSCLPLFLLLCSPSLLVYWSYH